MYLARGGGCELRNQKVRNSEPWTPRLAPDMHGGEWLRAVAHFPDGVNPPWTPPTNSGISTCPPALQPHLEVHADGGSVADGTVQMRRRSSARWRRW